MTLSRTRTAALALLMSAAAGPVLAASSTASSASDSASTSVGSLSTSVGKSSDSSSSKDTKVAAGDYQVIEVAAATDRPATLRVRLQAVADGSADGELFLYVPLQAVARAPLGRGDLITAHTRPYGVAFERGGEAFFLVLADAQYRELSSRPVTL